MTPRGHLLHIRLHLPHAPRHALTNLPYLGGVLHGAIRRRWLSLPAKQYAALDPSHLTTQATDHNARPRWRLIPPPWPIRHPPQWLNDHQHLHLALVIHAGAELPIERAAAALQGLECVGAGREYYRVAQVYVQAQALPVPWPQPTLPILPAPPAITQPASHHLQVQWLTPLHLASKARIRAGHGPTAPTLLGLLRSLVTRAHLLEPAWAAAWGLGSPAWVGWEEHWRRQESPSTSDQATKSILWPYSSCTKQQVLYWQGLLGQQRWYTHLPPAALALLTIGPWLGVGEKPSFGCGHFEWQAEPLNDLQPDPGPKSWP
ncbi:MAG: hypothetical protein C4K60_02530 [Ideonella sp. MAG2]|nr:MAG: hypothetical protein C4K60_02530 [Ideonella sp. MAG2]